VKVFKGKVVGGKVELPAGVAADGTDVTVLISEGEATFKLTDDEVRELQASIDEISRGEVVDGWQLLAEISD
jgi:hypothetical protein